MAETKLGRVAEVPAQVGVPAAVARPIKAERFAGKQERALGKRVALAQFGVNHVTLEPGAISSLRHWHEAEDEFVYILSGKVTLEDDNGAHVLEPGAFAGFPAGSPNAHHFVNRSSEPVILLVVGSRRRGDDCVHYPDDPLGPVRR